MLADKDDDSEDKKQQTRSKQYEIAKKYVLIVNKQIESWYISGSNIDYDKTEKISKTIFSDLTRGRRRTHAMIEILRNFDIEKAKRQNDSFSNMYENLELLDIMYNSFSQAQTVRFSLPPYKQNLT